MKPILCFLLGLPILASAQSVTTGTSSPRAVFQPIDGGYLLKQPPGPSLGQVTELNPSAGIQGRGAFGGGSKFRSSGAAGMKSFDMGGVYDMPIPKTGKTVPVTAITPLARSSVARALFKSLPIIGNAYALGELLQAIGDEWDTSEPPAPGESTTIDASKGTVTRVSEQFQWEYVGGYYSSPGAACSTIKDNEGVSLGFSAVYVAPSLYDCQKSGNSAGQVIRVSTGQTTRSAPTTVTDKVADDTEAQSPQKIDDLFEAAKDKSGISIPVPNNSPTSVTGPATADPKTTTTNNPDGSSTSTTTITNIVYQGAQILITNTTTTTNTSPSGDVTTGPTTTTTETPDPVPDTPSNPTPPTSETSLLCELFPNILACKTLDDPGTEDIPKRTENLELKDGPQFSGGGCIPDLVVSIHGHQITVISMSTPCGWIESFMKPLVLLFASITAVFIVVPRE